MFDDKVRASPELARILALPSRPMPSEAELEALATTMTGLLRTPTGSQKLHHVQALALHDIGVYGGAFCPIGVGRGKTLITLIAPWILQSARPLLLLPASLISKTIRDRDGQPGKPGYAHHWLIPNNICMYSYDMLGRVQAAKWLDDYEPDLIIGDEIHRLKNREAAVTRRIDRYMRKHPKTRFVGLSGTMMGESLNDFAHILRWCLKTNAPIPSTVEETYEWAAALDEKPPGNNELKRYEVGALSRLVRPDDLADGATSVVAARRGYRRRLTETPGVVSSVGDGEAVNCSLYIRALRYLMKEVTDEHIKKLRLDYQTPDDWDVTPVDVWRHSRELSLGFHNIWEPRPPDPWREARRAWFAFVREIISRSRTVDSPQHVEQMVDSGELAAHHLPTGQHLLAKWREQQATGFKPNSVPVWHDDSALHVALEWMKQGPGIVWVGHVPFGKRLSELSGAPYYGEDGLDANGVFIDDGDPKQAVIASIAANREGRNLQELWSRNLITSPMTLAKPWQQLIARTHRPGQRADQVEVDIFLGCIEHANAWRDALVNAAVVRDTTGEQFKILTADIDWPSETEIASWSGAAWGVVS